MRLIAANFKAKMSAAKTRADQQTLLASEPDVVTLCEIGGMARALLLRRGFKRAGMTMWASIPDPIAWRSDWELLAKGKHHLSDATNVGPGGAGPTVLRKKDAPWVLLHDPAGDVHFVINAHLAPQPDLNGKRGQLHSQQVDALAAKIAAVRAENPLAVIHVLGDLNTPDRARLAPVTDLGIDFGAVTNDMHGHQLIYIGSDWAGTRRLRGGLNTDHDAVVADVKRKAPVPTPTPHPQPPFDKVTYRGKLMDNKTMYGVMAAERKLGYPLTITQGCYNPGGVKQSAGTHDGGGVVDLAPWDWENKVRVLRNLGWAAWHRTPAEGPWPEHIHAVMVDQGALSASAAEQVVQYRNGQNGLANHGPDTFPYRPNPVPVFDYQAALRDDRIRARITGMQARIKGLRDRISANRARITYKGVQP